MFKQIAKRLVDHKQVSWKTMAGDTSICFALMLQLPLWNKVVSPLVSGIMPLILGAMWIVLGIYPLFLENRTTSAAVSGWGIIASGCCIMGLGISMILPLNTEVSWMPRMALVFYSLAILAWIFVLLQAASITRSLLIGVAFFVLASGYAFFYNARVIMEVIVSDVPYIDVYWDQGIAYILNGTAVIVWVLLILRKIAVVKLKPIVHIFILWGVVYIGLGIVLTMALAFP